MRLKVAKQLFFTFTLSAIIILSFIQAGKIGEVSAQPETISIDPQASVANPGEFFSVDVDITGATTGVSSWEFKLGFDPEMLQTDEDMITEGDFLSNVGSTYFTVLVSGNYVMVGCMLLEPTTATGSGTLATIQFEVMDPGKCTLRLYDTLLLDIDLDEILHSTEDGEFYTEYPKAAFIYYTEANPPASPGKQPIFKAVVDEEITFNASFISYNGKYGGSYDPDTMTNEDPDGNITSYQWDFGDLTTGSNIVATHVYDNPGSYTVALNVTDNDGYEDSYDRTVSVIIHDIAVTDIEVEPETIRPGQLATIDITVLNQGTDAEYFNITCYYDSTAIWYNETLNQEAYSSALAWDPVAKMYGITIEPDENMTVSFTWNTTNVQEGTYTILANASLTDSTAKSIKEPEMDKADNTKTVTNILVAESAPVASFTFSPTKPRVDQTVTFDASGSNDVDGWITTYTWDFGDGNVTAVANTTIGYYWIITHQYSKVAKYAVELTVTDNATVSVSTTRDVEVAVHDINVTSVTINPTTAAAGDSVSIYVDVKNEGGFTENCTVTAYYDNVAIDAQNITNLKSEKLKTLTFTWNTSGVSSGTYWIRAQASEVPYEANTTNNVRIASQQVTINVHDIAITSISASPATPRVGDLVSLNITIKNEGGFTEIFSVTAYYDSNMIAESTDINLNAHAETTLNFMWNTSGVSSGTYTLRAEASVVSGETDTADNTRTYGVITIERGVSDITMSVSPSEVTVEDSVTINGSITPTRKNVNVTIHLRLSGEEDWTNLSSVQTDEAGRYSHVWNPTTAGTYELKVSWPGDSNTLSDESTAQTVTVKEAPDNIWLYAGVVIGGAAVVAILFYFLRRRKP